MKYKVGDIVKFKTFTQLTETPMIIIDHVLNMRTTFTMPNEDGTLLVPDGCEMLLGKNEIIVAIDEQGYELEGNAGVLDWMIVKKVGIVIND